MWLPWGKTRYLYGSAAFLTRIHWASNSLKYNSERTSFTVKFTPLVGLKSHCLIPFFFHKNGTELKDDKNPKPNSKPYLSWLRWCLFSDKTSLWVIEGFYLRISLIKFFRQRPKKNFKSIQRSFWNCFVFVILKKTEISLYHEFCVLLPI